jgi:Peptidase S24-like
MSTDPAQLEFLLNQTLNQTRRWLDPPPMPPVLLRRSSDLLIGQLRESLGRGNRGDIRRFMDRLTELSDKIQKSNSQEYREPAVIKIECALAAYRMQNYLQAVEFLESATKVCKDGAAQHFEAVIRSMLGCVQWRLSQQDDNAIASWEQSIKSYEDLQKNRNGMARSGWYEDRIDELNSILELALGLSGTPSPATPVAETPSTSSAAAPDVSSTLTGDTLRLFSVVEEVQAGSFGGVGAYPNFLGYVEMSQCQINSVAHYVVNLRGTERATRISWDRSYGVIKINGDSMNAQGIDNGDYVLLHFQKDANNGDIVASQIMKDEAEATLKLFLKREKEILLRFCSHNPLHKEDNGRDKEYHFNGYNDGEFQIVGVAIAVFKPLNVTS